MVYEIGLAFVVHCIYPCRRGIVVIKTFVLLIFCATTLTVQAQSTGQSGAISVADGGALDLNGQTFVNTNALTLNGTGVSAAGARERAAFT